MRGRGMGWIVAATLAFTLAGPAFAEKPDKIDRGNHGGGKAEHGHGNAGNHPPGKGRSNAQPVTVTASQRTYITQYFMANPIGAGSLPPGIAKNLARGKPLPPGLAARPVPVDLRARLPVCSSGLDCIVLGADLLILDAVHGIVREIVRGVVR